MAITQLNICLYGLFFYIFDRADKGYIWKDRALKGSHDPRSIQGQTQREKSITQPNIVSFGWFFDPFARADKGYIYIVLKG